MKRTLFLCALLFVLVVQISWGQIPQIISYQGVLTDSKDNTVPDRPDPNNPSLLGYNLTFNLYDANGQVVWGPEIHSEVPVKNGIFNVTLGSIKTLGGLDFNEPYLLGVTVENDNELTPRTPLTASPYSFAVAGDNIFPANGQVFVESVPTIGSEKGGIIHYTTSLPNAWQEAITRVNSNGLKMNLAFHLVKRADPENSKITRDVLVLNENGNVGIGTPIPKAKLEVNGGGLFTPGGSGGSITLEHCGRNKQPF